MEKAQPHSNAITIITSDKREFRITTALLSLSPRLLAEARIALNAQLFLTDIHSTEFETIVTCLNALMPLRKNISGTYMFKDACQAVFKVLSEMPVQRLIIFLDTVDKLDVQFLIRIVACIIAYKIKPEAINILKAVRSYCEARNWRMSDRCCEVLKRYLMLALLNKQELSVGDYCTNLTGPLTFMPSVTLRARDLTDLNGIQSLPQPERIEALDISSNTLLVCSIFDVPSQPPLFQSFTNLTSLNLSDNRLRALPIPLLRGLINLRILNMSRNHLKDISTDALSDVVKLQELCLSSNEVEEIEDTALVRLTELQTLELQNNQLTRFRCTLPSSLQILNLESNRLRSFPQNLFARARVLRLLKLAGNALEQNSTGSFLRAYQIPPSVAVNYGSQNGPHTVNVNCNVM